MNALSGNKKTNAHICSLVVFCDKATGSLDAAESLHCMLSTHTGQFTINNLIFDEETLHEQQTSIHEPLSELGEDVQNGH